MRKAVIVGGGISGLISGILLARAGISCLIIEKKEYPFHRVCGEYISNEALPFLKKSKIFPEEFSPVAITEFQLSSIRGYSATMPLDLGGFGISRFTFDHFLFRQAERCGVEFLLNTEVTSISFSEDNFYITTSSKNIEAQVIIGAFGKRSRLDIGLNRDFIKKRSPYVGVKYHIETDHPRNLIALHNFQGGYCGISNIEDGKSNLCYLTHRDNLKTYGDIKRMEENVLHRNPLLKSIFLNSRFLFEKPEVINEISFETKEPVHDHILMAGDAAGMITPLCGNGMAMAIHSASMLSNFVIDYCNNKLTRHQLEQRYTDVWRKNFKQRLWMGRQVQKLFGNKITSSIAVNLAIHSRPVANMIIRNTHGEPFE